MDPISLSLLAISACSVAIRRIEAADRMQRLAAAEQASELGPRALVKHAISQQDIDLVSMTSRRRELRKALVSLAAHHDVIVLLDTPLSDFLEVRGQNSILLERALKLRTIDAIICDAQGLPLCGLDLPATDESHSPDPVRTRVFRNAGLPLVVLPENCSWHEALTRLDDAFLQSGQSADGLTDVTEVPVLSPQARSA